MKTRSGSMITAVVTDRVFLLVTKQRKGPRTTLREAARSFNIRPPLGPSDLSQHVALKSQRQRTQIDRRPRARRRLPARPRPSDRRSRRPVRSSGRLVRRSAPERPLLPIYCTRNWSAPTDQDEPMPGSDLETQAPATLALQQRASTSLGRLQDDLARQEAVHPARHAQPVRRQPPGRVQPGRRCRSDGPHLRWAPHQEPLRLEIPGAQPRR